MTAAVPTNEPFQLRVGDTWKWKRQDLPDYPATSGGWTLKYALKNAASHIEITAAAAGDFFSVTVAMATTAGYTAGRYRWVAWVESVTERYDVDSGWIDILAKYNSTTALDDRSIDRICLDNIESVLSGNATPDVLKYTIGTRSLERYPAGELQKLRDYYRARVFAEENAERRRNGYGAGRLVAKL